MDRAFGLTAELFMKSFAWLDAIRCDHFPIERDVLLAHAGMVHRCRWRKNQTSESVRVGGWAAFGHFDAGRSRTLMASCHDPARSDGRLREAACSALRDWYRVKAETITLR
jgi:hypothetical protein